jgi:aminoglycoside phosphotransferase (APT) family kinase protein
MGWQQGRTRHDLLGRAAVTELAELTVAMHRTPVTAEQRPPVFCYRGPAVLKVPSWARRPALWRRAIELRQAGAPATPYGLLHRDFHLGNLLWQGDTITGLIDWTDASWGPPDLDVAHLCSDLAMLHTLEEVQSFRAAYTAAGGHLDPDPDAARFWMVADVLGFLPDPAHVLTAYAANRPDITADQVRFGLEDLLALALTGSGRSFPGR